MEKDHENYLLFLKGDKQAMEEIIKNHKDGLTLYLAGFSHDFILAEDLMEDTFVKLIVDKPRFKGTSSFKTWLYSIGRNIAFDYYRKNKKVVQVPLDEGMVNQDEDIWNSYIKEEDKRLVHKAMDKLKTEYRQVLYLSFFEDMKNEEIAAALHKNKRQIENLLYQAKKALKNQLEKEGYTYEGL